MSALGRRIDVFAQDVNGKLLAGADLACRVSGKSAGEARNSSGRASWEFPTRIDGIEVSATYGGVTQSAISQHLRSLKQAGLIADRPEGRNVHYRADPKGLAPLVDWMAFYAVFWRERFANLRTLLKEIDP